MGTTNTAEAKGDTGVGYKDPLGGTPGSSPSLTDTIMKFLRDRLNAEATKAPKRYQQAYDPETAE